MKICGILLSLSLTVTLISCAAIIERQTENDLSPLNETDDDGVTDDERGDRDKRKIGVVKLGVTNGIINFVFGKLDAFIDAKTKALHVLDESNKIKNQAYGIDNTHSALGEFVSQLVSAKIKASSGSIGPVVNSATTFLTSASSGLTGAFAGKIAPLSSLSSGVVGSLSNGSGASGGEDSDNGDGGSNGGSNAAALTGILASISNVGSTSINSSNGGSNDGSTVDDDDSTSGNDAGGINIGVGMVPSTTTDDTPIFDRQKVSLDVPPTLIGGGFTLVSNISKAVSTLIMNSAHRTEQLLEVFKSLFRTIFIDKGLPSDDFVIPTKYYK